MYDLLQVMQQDGYLTSEELIALRKTCKELGENPVRVLRSLNIASSEQIQEYLQRYFMVRALDEKAIDLLDEGYQIYIPIDLAIHFSCFALNEENSILYVVMEDPSDRGVIQQLRFFLNKRIVAISATVFQLAKALSKIYRVNISNLRLTTVIEKSRGVIGGLKYESTYGIQAGMSLGPDSNEIDLSKEVEKNVNSFIADNNNLTSVVQVNNNSITSSMFEPSAEISLPDIDIKKSGSSVEPMIGEVNISLQQDNITEKKSFEEIDISKLSVLVNSALVKISLLQSRSQALDLLNTLLKSFNLSINLSENNVFQINGENYIKNNEELSQVEDIKSTVLQIIDPILNKILKMNDSN